MGEGWYALCTREGKEREALELLERKAGSGLFSLGRIPSKIKVFRSGGVLRQVEDVMFSGYVFIKTAYPKACMEMTARARAFPQPLCKSGMMGNARKGNLWQGQETAVPLEDVDLQFLQSVCGEDLGTPMGLTRICLDREGKIARADGVLNQFLDRVVRLNLHKRFAVAEIPLFNRLQPVLFGIYFGREHPLPIRPLQRKGGSSSGPRPDTDGQEGTETCVCCGRRVNIPVNEPIGLRAFYIEGAGQLCCDCYHTLYPGRLGNREGMR
jgi:hypothetical protein